MAKWVAVRGGMQNKLLFRYDPESERIEVFARGELAIVCLEDYRLPDQRPAPAPKVAQKVGVDNSEQSC